MKLWVSPYSLHFNYSYNKKKLRQGFLIKMETENFKAGYADCFPWPELGDLRVDDCLRYLRSGMTDALLKKSLYFATRDGEAREESRSLFESKSFLKNYWLIIHPELVTENLIQEKIELGFTTCKLKMGLNIDTEAKALALLAQNLLRLRLDFNGRMADEYIPLLREFSSMIDYIEDPYEEAMGWSEFQESMKIPLAYDQPSFGLDNVKAQVQIVKPAKQELLSIDSNSTVFTSYMDHPVGIAHGMWEAESFGAQSTDYGFMSYSVYQETPFNEYINTQGNRFHFREGLGIGFDDLWESIKWQPI